MVLEKSEIRLSLYGCGSPRAGGRMQCRWSRPCRKMPETRLQGVPDRRIHTARRDQPTARRLLRAAGTPHVETVEAWSRPWVKTQPVRERVVRTGVHSTRCFWRVLKLRACSTPARSLARQTQRPGGTPIQSLSSTAGGTRNPRAYTAALARKSVPASGCADHPHDPTRSDRAERSDC